MTLFIRLLPILSALVVFIVIWYVTKHLERQKWNNGFCPKCGDQPWAVFDMNSSGAYGIVCRRCNNYARWISHHSVMREKK